MAEMMFLLEKMIIDCMGPCKIERLPVYACSFFPNNSIVVVLRFDWVYDSKGGKKRTCHSRSNDDIVVGFCLKTCKLFISTFVWSCLTVCFINANHHWLGIPIGIVNSVFCFCFYLSFCCAVRCPSCRCRSFKTSNNNEWIQTHSHTNIGVFV